MKNLDRSIKLPHNRSLFLFGPRNTGKSNTDIQPHDISTFNRLCHDLPGCEAICLSNDTYAKQIDNVLVLPWQQGIKQYFKRD